MSNLLPLSEWAEHGTEIQRRHAANVARLKAAEPPEPSRPSVGEFFASLAAVKACPHLVPPSCGCNFGRCSKYDRPTSYHECLACGEYKTPAD